MAEATVLKCAVCGGPAQPGDRACHYCGSAIATVRCVFCFHANTVDALHCSGCGAELGAVLEAAGGKVLCTDCHVELTAYDSPAGTLFSCERCGGQFLQHALFRSLLEQPILIGHAAPGLTLPAKNPLSVRVHYRACPICTAMMNRKNFGITSGVIVDVCARHGTWFDPGELPRVLEFARQGGLEHERRREAERKQAQQRELRVAARTGVGHEGSEHYQDVGSLDLHDVLQFFRDLLKP